ncbi:MAG TPA: HNH endonuclease [Rhodoblastus sp.]|nr:HNH endonuclease [Rhodoblastus sp.]
MICALCGRPLGVKIEAHHMIPKSHGGRATVALHPICHRKIHTTLSEAELRDRFHTVESLRENDEIRTFLKWVANKPPDFYAPTFECRWRKGKRRRS